MIVAAAAVLRLLAPGAVVAADPRYPDWPCNQLKVPEISVAAVWAGPSIDGVGDTWENDPTIRELVPRLAARRTPMDEAEKLIADFLTGSTRIFEDRRKTINYVCEVPGLIERRLFSLARAIQQSLE